MAPKHSEHQNLPEFLKANASAVLQSWVDMTRPQLSSQPPRRLSFEEFRDDVPDALANLAEFLENRRELETSSDLPEVASQHGHCRWRQGFNLKDLIRDWGNLQQVVLEMVNQFYEEAAGETTMNRSTVVNLVVAFFTEAICDSVARFDELRREEAVRMNRQLERMRHHFEQINDFRERLLQDLSHDIRSPLTAISGASCLLKTEENEQEHEDLYELGGIIDESVSAATELLNSLRDLSQIDAGLAELSLSRVDVVALLQQVLDGRKASTDGASGGSDITLTGPGSLVVEADAANLRKTFENILRFARPGRSGENAESGTGRMALRSMEDGWELQLRYLLPDSSGPGEREAAHEEMNALVLRRLCLMQFASFKSETDELGGQLITLKFPSDYRGME
ncbi:MAG: sensor histidine kinase [Opitutales bacterium]